MFVWRKLCFVLISTLKFWEFRTLVYWRQQIFARIKMYLLLILMFMYCFLLEVNQKLSDFRFPILNAKSIFRTFVRLLWDNRLAHIETLVCVMKYLAFLFLWFWVVNIELVLYFFLKSTIHSRQTTLVWHGLYFLFDIGLFHATSVIVLRIYRRPRSGNWPMKIPHFGGVFRIK